MSEKSNVLNKNALLVLKMKIEYKLIYCNYNKNLNFLKINFEVKY